jgi:hypothetical protein
MRSDSGLVQGAVDAVLPRLRNDVISLFQVDWAIRQAAYAAREPRDWFDSFEPELRAATAVLLNQGVTPLRAVDDTFFPEDGVRDDALSLTGNLLFHSTVWFGMGVERDAARAIPPDSAVEWATDAVLISALDDLAFSSIGNHVREESARHWVRLSRDRRAADSPGVKTGTMRVVTTLLERDDIEFYFLSFPWPTTSGSQGLVDRLRDEWETIDRSISEGDVGWLRATDSGELNALSVGLLQEERLRGVRTDTETQAT